MYKRIIPLVALALLLAMVSCNNSKKNTDAAPQVITPMAADESVVNTTVYEGTLPCADCPGIKASLSIYILKNGDVKYSLKEEYLERDVISTEKGNVAVEEGFGSDESAIVFILSPDESEDVERYYVCFSNDDSKLTLLDGDKQLIDSKLNFTLTKVK